MPDQITAMFMTVVRTTGLLPLLLTVSIANAQDAAVEMSSSAADAGSAQSLEPADEYAMMTRDRNAKAALPDLLYWGVGPFQWGMTRQTLPTSRAGTFASVPHAYAFGFDQRAGLESIKWVFGEPLKGSAPEETQSGRLARLANYHKIKRELVAKYGSPSHPFSPDDNVPDRSKDSYVRGVQSEYRIAWYGPETAVQLSLSDEELVVRFDRQATSQASERIEGADRAARVVAERMARMRALQQGGQ
jgi:hypothetical protein